MSLRVTLAYHPDEVRLSLVSRLAMANSYPSLESFTALNGTSAAAFNSGTPESIELLSRWSGLNPDRLLSYDIRSSDHGATWRLGPALMSKDMRPGRNHRYCPRCVIADLATGDGREITRPYIRVNWMTRAVRHCVDHHCSIVEAPFDKRNPGDFSRFVEKNLGTIRTEASKVTSVSSVVVDEYVTARLQGHPSNEFLDRLEVYVAVDLCKYIGGFERKHLRQEKVLLELGEVSDSERGFAIASNGAAALKDVISSAIDHKKPLALEMKAFFGKLRPWLLRNRNKPEFELLVELFQSIVERCIPTGEDEVFILPGRKRHLHSVRSASIEYHMMEDRVYQLIVEAGLSSPSNLTSGRIYFDAAAGHEVLTAAVDTMTSREVSSALGIHIDRLRPIFEANYIPRVEVTEGPRVFSRIRRVDFEGFAEKLTANIATDDERQFLVSINQVGRFAYSTLDHVIGLILSKKLQTLRRIDDTGLISGLAVDPNELKPFSVQARQKAAKAGVPVFDNTQCDPDLLNVDQARRTLATAPGTVRELLRLGQLKTVAAFNPATRRMHNYVCAKSLAAFQDKHVSLAHLAEQRKMFAVTVRDKLREVGVRSIFEPTGRNSRFYRKSDVQHLDLTT